MGSTRTCVCSIIGFIILAMLPHAKCQFDLSGFFGGSNTNNRLQEFSRITGVRIPGITQPCRTGQFFTLCVCNVRCEDISTMKQTCSNPCNSGCACLPGTYLSRGRCVQGAACLRQNAINNIARGTTRRPATTRRTQPVVVISSTAPPVSPQVAVSSLTPASGCLGNSEPTTCATCDIFCSQRQNPPPCPVSCRVGCACPRNTYLNAVGNCVAANQCPGAVPSTVSVPIFTRPSTRPPITISTPRTTNTPPPTTTSRRIFITRPPVITTRRTTTPRPSTTVRTTRRTTQIPPTLPPLVCPAGQTPTDCVCDRTCENRLQNIRCDDTTCEPGCACPDGLLRNGDRCVYIDGCFNNGFVNPVVGAIEGGEINPESEFGIRNPGFFGPFAAGEGLVAECNPPCQFGGTCIASFREAFCECPPGRGGVDCSLSPCNPECLPTQTCRQAGFFGFRFACF